MATRFPMPGGRGFNSPQTRLARSVNSGLNEWLADPVPGEDDWLELSNLDANHPVVLTSLLVEKNGELHRVAVPRGGGGRRPRPALLRPWRPAARMPSS